jgi:N-acyl-phosphatidylethanolamine-hydrolysing phospholipase D
MTMTSSTIRVSETESEARKDAGKPAHWVDDAGTSFKNPWASWREHDWRDQLYIVFGHSKNCPTAPSNISSLIPSRPPTWDTGDEGAAKIKATWMGHASFFVEFPARSFQGGSTRATRGVRILFDPIFSERCSPVNWAGFKRITPPACSFEELPEIDVVVISVRPPYLHSIMFLTLYICSMTTTISEWLPSLMAPF